MALAEAEFLWSSTRSTFRPSDSRMEIWLCSLSAIPSVSKPGPRLAVVAGTQTVTDGFLTARDIASRIGASQVVAGRDLENAPFPSGIRFPDVIWHSILAAMLERL